MKSFEEWIMYVFGGFVAVGSVVAGRVIKVQDEHEKRLAKVEADAAAFRAHVGNTKDSLERIESKLDRAIEREHGA